MLLCRPGAPATPNAEDGGTLEDEVQKAIGKEGVGVSVGKPVAHSHAGVLGCGFSFCVGEGLSPLPLPPERSLRLNLLLF